MDLVSGLIAKRLSPEAVKPFWSEVLIAVIVLVAGSLFVLLSAVIEVLLTGQALPQTWRIGIICILPLVFAAPLRTRIRGRFGLTTPPAFRTFPPGGRVFQTRRPASDLPAWQRSGSNYFWSSLGNMIGLLLPIAILWVLHGLVSGMGFSSSLLGGLGLGALLMMSGWLTLAMTTGRSNLDHDA
jgi:hypothetical protein